MTAYNLTQVQERVILKGLYERCDNVNHYNLLKDGSFLAVYDGFMTLIINNKGHNVARKDKKGYPC